MHITIAGNLGSGKSTVCGVLKEKYSFSVYSTGVIQRELAEKMNLTTLEMNRLMSDNVKYDHLIDDEVARISEEKKDTPLVFDSRMAWLFAKNSFRVYLIINPLVAAQRVIDTRKSSVESYSSIEDAQNQLAERANVENERFKKIYNVDNFCYKNYDLIVDTTILNPEQIADIIYENYKKYSEKAWDEPVIVIAPQNLCFDEKIDEADVKTDNFFKDAPIVIENRDGKNYVVDGSAKVSAALIEKLEYVYAKLA